MSEVEIYEAIKNNKLTKAERKQLILKIKHSWTALDIIEECNVTKAERKLLVSKLTHAYDVAQFIHNNNATKAELKMFASYGIMNEVEKELSEYK